MKLLLGAAAAFALLCAAGTAEAKRFKVGEPIPDFDLVLLDGTHVHPADLKGQVVVINFWATWCVPCRTELPLLDAYYRIGQAKGLPLRIFAVTTEDSAPISQLKPLFAVLHMPAAKRVKGGALSDVDEVPTNYVIDKAGVLRYAEAGSFTLEGLNEVLIPLMKEPAPTAAP
jgi:cytochrome c biogenesis protein CcmG, thiol:disulfide interchange protein DsbE